MTPQEKLTAKIREALPHLMELKENCIVETSSKNYIIKTIDNFNDFLLKDESNNCRWHTFLDIKGRFTIIGAEPTLNDVLMYAMMKSCIFSNFENNKIRFSSISYLKSYYNLQLPYSQ